LLLVAVQAEHNIFIIMKQLAQAAQVVYFIQQQLFHSKVTPLQLALAVRLQIQRVQLLKHLQKEVTLLHLV
jgi:hypothetical protein